MDYIDDDDRYPIFENVFNDKTPPSTAAEEIACRSSFAIEVDVEALWNVITCCAMKFPTQQGKLVNILVGLSKLPDAKTSDGKPMMKHGMQVWRDFPTLGWHLRELTDAVETAYPCFSYEEGKERSQQDTISAYANLHRFIALLMATKEPVFNYSWFALMALREALEVSPSRRVPGTFLDADVLSAAEWIKILGVEIYQWEEQFRDNLGRLSRNWIPADFLVPVHNRFVHPSALPLAMLRHVGSTHSPTCPVMLSPPPANHIIVT